MLGMGNKVGQRSKIPISLLFISLPITPCKASSNGSLKAPPDCSPSDTFQAAAAAGVTDVTATEELSRPPLQEYGSRRPHCRRCGNPNCFPTSIVGSCWSSWVQACLFRKRFSNSISISETGWNKCSNNFTWRIQPDGLEMANKQSPPQQTLACAKKHQKNSKAADPTPRSGGKSSWQHSVCFANVCFICIKTDGS